MLGEGLLGAAVLLESDTGPSFPCNPGCYDYKAAVSVSTKASTTPFLQEGISPVCGGVRDIGALRLEEGGGGHSCSVTHEETVSTAYRFHGRWLSQAAMFAPGVCWVNPRVLQLPVKQASGQAWSGWAVTELVISVPALHKFTLKLKPTFPPVAKSSILVPDSTAYRPNSSPFCNLFLLRISQSLLASPESTAFLPLGSGFRGDQLTCSIRRGCPRWFAGTRVPQQGTT
ncbi:hypothetical protein Bbelb_007210 [Branchiostoma belcheri]|nr:hypothetical protein Bbelb_007210 [Branchiostoma belcheri]